MTQVSLVIHYGPKPARLQALIADCQARISKLLGARFQPYDPRQVHGTLVSLERTPENANLNFAQLRNCIKPMDFEGLLSYLRTSQAIPFQIQVGGFDDHDYPFISKGKKPYERSFAIQDNKVVLIGWPASTPSSPGAAPFVYPNTLDDIRKAAQAFNVLHTYHRNPADMDNDFYFRIGLADGAALTARMRKKVERELRAYLKAISPVILEVAINDIYVVAYTDNCLPYESTRAWSIADPAVTGDFIRSLYD
jgi:hypothetical protein